jgi:adenylyltransferase/sulfurtransferase
MRELNPEVLAHAREENIVHRAGLGVFLWADVVISGVDNREARIFINSACAGTGRAWVDGAIEGLSGVVRAFRPRDGPCYECTMSALDRKLVAERRSCALLARDAVALGRVPATATAASVIGALQVQEALKILHGQPALLGEGLHLDGFASEASRVRYPRRDDCPGHEGFGPVTPLGRGAADVTLGDLLALAERDLGPGAVLEFSRDVVLSLECPGCGRREDGKLVLGEVGERRAKCPACGEHRIVDPASSATRDGPVDLARTPAEIGLPLFDIMVARRGLEMRRAYFFDADADTVLGPLSARAWRSGVGSP